MRVVQFTFPLWGRLAGFQLFVNKGLSAKTFVLQKQRLEPLPGVFRLLALVQTTRWTGGYDYSFSKKTPLEAAGESARTAA